MKASSRAGSTPSLSSESTVLRAEGGRGGKMKLRQHLPPRQRRQDQKKNLQRSTTKMSRLKLLLLLLLPLLLPQL